MARSTQIPPYSAGTISIGAQSGGYWPVTGVGTVWTSPDGVANWTIAVGDMLIVPGVGFGWVGVAPTTNTALSLSYWSGATVSAGASYVIYRYSGIAPGALGGLITNLLALGSTSNPFAALSALVGDGKINFTSDGSGNILVKVRAASGTDSAYVTALTINETTGKVSGVGIADGTGFRNRLRNASFAINQRVVSGAVTLAAGAYGHDGVKAGASGATYTFAASGTDTTITVTAGTLILPIEASMIEGGAYTLSHAGTAQARVWQGAGNTGSGSYASAPLTATGLNAGTQTNVEFSAGTILRPQFEPGAVVTAFERRPIAVEKLLCQRYFFTTFEGIAPAQNVGFGAGEAICPRIASGATTHRVVFHLPVPMRARPTVVLYNPGAANSQMRDAEQSADCSDTQLLSYGQALNRVAVYTITPAAGAVGSVLAVHFTASAEI